MFTSKLSTHEFSRPLPIPLPTRYYEKLGIDKERSARVERQAKAIANIIFEEKRPEINSDIEDGVIEPHPIGGKYKLTEEDIRYRKKNCAIEADEIDTLLIANILLLQNKLHGLFHYSELKVILFLVPRYKYDSYLSQDHDECWLLSYNTKPASLIRKDFRLSAYNYASLSIGSLDLFNDIQNSYIIPQMLSEKHPNFRYEENFFWEVHGTQYKSICYNNPSDINERRTPAHAQWVATHNDEFIAINNATFFLFLPISAEALEAALLAAIPVKALCQLIIGYLDNISTLYPAAFLQSEIKDLQSKHIALDQPVAIPTWSSTLWGASQEKITLRDYLLKMMKTDHNKAWEIVEAIQNAEEKNTPEGLKIITAAIGKHRHGFQQFIQERTGVSIGNTAGTTLLSQITLNSKDSRRHCL